MFAPGIVDFIILDNKPQTLCAIVERAGTMTQCIPGTISYKAGLYQRNVQSEIATSADYPVDFDGFELTAYQNLRLPVTWATDKYEE